MLINSTASAMVGAVVFHLIQLQYEAQVGLKFLQITSRLNTIDKKWIFIRKTINSSLHPHIST